MSAKSAKAVVCTTLGAKLEGRESKEGEGKEASKAKEEVMLHLIDRAHFCEWTAKERKLLKDVICAAHSSSSE